MAIAPVPDLLETPPRTTATWIGKKGSKEHLKPPPKPLFVKQIVPIGQSTLVAEFLYSFGRIEFQVVREPRYRLQGSKIG
jgi:hypothetical protein